MVTKEMIDERNEEIKKEYHEALKDIMYNIEESIEISQKLEYKINREKLEGLVQDLKNTLDWLEEEKEDNGYVEV